MTPEEVETRLEALRTPPPPERLRERCLRGSSPRRRLAAWAVAASFLMFAVVVGFIATSRDETSTLIERLGHPDPAERDRAALRLIELGDEARPQLGKARSHRDAEIAFRASELWENPERSRRLIQATDDPVLRKKLEGLLQKNPGSSILVVRVNELRDGKIGPVTKGFRLSMFVENATTDPDPLEDPGRIGAEVDADGALLFVAEPGQYRAVGYHHMPEGALRNLSFIWEYKHFVAKPDEVVILADALFAPWMEWTSPAAGAAFSLKGQLNVSWKSYPEVRRVKLKIERRAAIPTGGFNYWDVGTLTLDGPQDIAPSLALLRHSKPFEDGDTLLLSLTGYDEKGKPITGSKGEREILFKKE